tara:strand:- start:84 stop:1037 length:954 start_codon:yes stop_codon:yes gene_type:complete
MKILIFIQSDDGQVNRLSAESICVAQKLKAATNCSITAACLSPESVEWAKDKNIDTIYDCTDNNNLQEYHPYRYTDLAENLINSTEPNLILVGHTYQARDWVPRLSARLDIPFISDCINLSYDGAKTIFTRQVYQGKINQDIVSSSNKTIASIQAGSFNPDDIELGTTSIRSIDKSSDSNLEVITQGEKFQEKTGGVDLTKANIIVSVGRGIGKEENIPIAIDLAKKLNAELGSSRPIVDQGWVEHERQIGSSGQVVSPKLYFAIGISGAIQHQVGMKGSENIIAINKDPNAPIFEIADYGIVGEIFDVVPKVIDKL